MEAKLTSVASEGVGEGGTVTPGTAGIPAGRIAKLFTSKGGTTMDGLGGAGGWAVGWTGPELGGPSIVNARGWLLLAICD